MFEGNGNVGGVKKVEEEDKVGVAIEERELEEDEDEEPKDMAFFIFSASSIFWTSSPIITAPCSDFFP